MMYNNLYAVKRHPEQPVKLEKLEALVRQSGRVDGDLPPHTPGGVVEGLLGCDGFQLRLRQLLERSARSGEDEPSDALSVLAAVSLEDGGYLAVNGQQPRAGAMRRGCDELAGGYKRLLVRKGDVVAGLQRRHHGGEPGKPRHGADDQVGLRELRELDQPLLAPCH